MIQVDPVQAPPCADAIRPAVRTLYVWIEGEGRVPYTWRTRHIGGDGLSCRHVNDDPSKPMSLHADGRAYDVGCPLSPEGSRFLTEQLDPLAAWLVKHAERLGVQEIVWNGRDWNPEDGWTDYGGSRDHRDHLHFALNIAGASRTVNEMRDIIAAIIALDHPPAPDPTPEADYMSRSAFYPIHSDGSRPWPHVRLQDPTEPDEPSVLVIIGREAELNGAVMGGPDLGFLNLPLRAGRAQEVKEMPTGRGVLVTYSQGRVQRLFWKHQPPRE